MEPQEKTEILEASQQYVASKFRLRRLFPSLNTLEEIDNIASVLVDVASSSIRPTAIASASPNRAQTRVRRRPHVMSPTKTPSTSAETAPKPEKDLFLSRLATVIKEGRHGKVTPTGIVNGFEKHGWKIVTPPGQTAKNVVFDTLVDNQDRFTRRGAGVFGVRKRASRPQGTVATKKTTPTPRGKLSQVGPNVPPLEVFNVIDKDFPNQEFSCSAVAMKLNVHPYRIRGSFRRLHEEGFIIPKGGKGTKNRAWVFSPKSRRLNGSGAKAVAEAFASA